MHSNTPLADIIARPKNLLILGCAVLSGVLAFPSLVIGPAMSLFMPRHQWVNFIVMLSAMCFVVLLVLLSGHTWHQLEKKNCDYLILLLSANYLFIFDLHFVTLALLTSFSLSGLIVLAREASDGLSDELKQTAKGMSKSTWYLPEKRCRNKARALTEAASIDGTILGINRATGLPVALRDEDANCHTLAVGTTGSGKTTGILNVVESAIDRHHPVIIVDGKGDIALSRQVERYAVSKGTKFYGFSMVGNSVKYNPLASGGITSKKDRIIALRSWSEEHYRKIAEGYLQDIFYILMGLDIRVDLASLAIYLNPDVLSDVIKKAKNDELMVLAKNLVMYQKDISSMIAEIKNLVNSEIGSLFDCSSGDVLTLEKALDERAVVYFCLQPLAFPAYAESLGKLIINDIKNLAAGQLAKSHKSKIFTLFDEFSVFAGEQVINLINQGRSAGIHAILSTQSLSDLRQISDAFAGQVLNNCNNFIIFRQNNPEDAEIIANIIGTNDTHEITSQISTKQDAFQLGTVRLTKKFITHPDEIKRLPFGEAVLINKMKFLTQRVLLRKGKIN